MRGALVLLAVAALAWLVPAAGAVEPVAVPLPAGSFGGELDGGALFYVAERRGRSTLERFDLSTRTRTVLYAPRRRAAIVRMHAAGGVVAVEVARGLFRSKVLAIDPLRGAPALIGSGRRYQRQNCGRSLKLEDVSESGDIVVSQATVPCGSRRGTFLVRAFRRIGPPLVLERRPTDIALVSDGSPYRMLQGPAFLTWGDRLARVRDVASGRVRRFAAPGPAWFFGEADVAADGRVLLSAVRGGPGGPHQRILLDERVVFDSIRTGSAFAQAVFCGRHTVLHVASRRRERIRLLDPPLLLRVGRPLAIDFTSTCDPHSFALLDGERERALVYDLPE